MTKKLDLPIQVETYYPTTPRSYNESEFVKARGRVLKHNRYAEMLRKISEAKN